MPSRSGTAVWHAPQPSVPEEKVVRDVAHLGQTNWGVQASSAGVPGLAIALHHDQKVIAPLAYGGPPGQPVLQSLKRRQRAWVALREGEQIGRRDEEPEGPERPEPEARRLKRRPELGGCVVPGPDRVTSQWHRHSPLRPPHPRPRPLSPPQADREFPGPDP